MYLVYSLLLTLGLIVLIPRFLFQALAHGKYLPGVRQRLGSLPPLSESTNPTVWLHCVSVGETQAARPFVRELRKQFPNYRLVVSTVTLTGQNVARTVFKDDATEVIYFPFDWNWSVRRSLRVIKPDVVLMMETELWPNFLHNCRKPRAIRVVCQATVVSGLSPTVIKVFRPIAKPQISRPIDVRI